MRNRVILIIWLQESAFHLAAMQGNLSKVESYLATGGDPDMPEHQVPCSLNSEQWELSSSYLELRLTSLITQESCVIHVACCTLESPYVATPHF